PPAAVAPRSPLSPHEIFHQRQVEGLVGDQLLQATVLVLELLEPPGLLQLQPAVLRPPPTQGFRGDAVAPTNLRHLPALGLAHDGQNLFVRESTLPHRILPPPGRSGPIIRVPQRGGKVKYKVLKSIA